ARDHRPGAGHRRRHPGRHYATALGVAARSAAPRRLMGAGHDAVAPYRQYLGRDADEVAGDLESFAALLLKWNRAQNLVSRETTDQLWSRHIVDSLQVLKLLRAGDRTLLDLGSGGGFPAIPLAIASGPGRHFVLVEPTAKKASFLRTANR